VLGKGRGGEKSIRFALSGCHDTTLAGVLSSLGAFRDEKWPPYTSHIAFELFRKTDEEPIPPKDPEAPSAPTSGTEKQASASRPGWLASMLGLRSGSENTSTPEISRDKTVLNPGASSEGIARRAYVSLSNNEKKKLDGYYVRLRYNDKIMYVPACRKEGMHLDGDESFCTLEAFKRVVDGYTPKSWKRECGMNLGKDVLGLASGTESWAGEIEEGY